jgi:cold shock CspA family protein
MQQVEIRKVAYMLGTCVQFTRLRGFGFLMSSEDPTLPDIFCHVSDIEPSPLWRRKFLLPGMKVQFNVESDATEQDPDRLRAKNIQVIAPIVIAAQFGSQPKTGGRS